jgi:raffinose/stachyose/melibiose transport system substrate-binding protein
MAQADGAKISRRDALVTAAKVGAGGAALATGLGTTAFSAPALIRAASPVSLTYMHWEPELASTNKWWMDILAGFTTLHPGVTIKNNYISINSYLPTLTSMAAAKSLPDLFHAHVLAAQLGRAGLTVNFRDYLPSSFISQFNASTIKQFTFDGSKLYALPVTAQTFGLFVNTPIMKKLGLTPPETWDDLIAMAPKIRKAGYVPVAWGNAQSNSGPDFVLPLIAQFGGDVYALDDLTKPGLSWNSTPVADAFALLQKLTKANCFPPGLNGVSQSPQAEQMMYRGQAAMLWEGSWFPSTAATAAPKSFLQNYTVAKQPALTKGGRHWTGDGSGAAVAVTKINTHVNMAIEFIKYMFSKPVYNAIIKNSQVFPSIPSAASQITDPITRTMIGYLPDGADHILFGVGTWNAVADASQAVIAGALDPAKAAAQVQASIIKTRKGKH